VSSSNPYDELPYRSRPIEWSAPEHLALCSFLHGGPRPALERYRALELGCGDGANLLPLAYYRRHASFVGVDASAGAIAVAEAHRRELGLDNVCFLHADFASAAGAIAGPFDYILAHGVVSWVSPEVRDRLFDLCAAHLAPGGLLYLNYNCKPGWNVRGMVRDFLRAQTGRAGGLRERAELARQVASTVASSMAGLDHPYSQLLAREFRFVSDSEVSYVAHEFLAPDNHAFWRSEWLELLGRRGFAYVADADFNRQSGRIAPDLAARIAACGLDGQPIEDTIDLLSYRQLHSPIVTQVAAARRAFAAEDLANLFAASPLRPLEGDGQSPRRFKHPSGYEVEAREEPICQALEALELTWPRGLALREIFDDVRPWAEDLVLLHRHGMIELRMVEPPSPFAAPELRDCERRWGGYSTDPYHRIEVASPAALVGEEKA
jgi:SAM-dependent methyltransferase